MRYLLTIVATLFCISLTAQELPERALVRKGNRAYNKNNYTGAIESYQKAHTAAPTSFEALFNYANALHKDEQYAKAEELYLSVEGDKLPTDADRADLYYNLGNSQFMQQKLQEALESYKASLRANPDDIEAKYNYAYTKKLLEDQQQDEDQSQDENEDGEGEDDQNQDQNQDQNEDQGDDEQDQNQDQNQDEKEQEQQEQPAEGSISPQEQAQMLDAIQAQEDKTQEKLEEEGKGVLIPGGKNW
ncbi:MAG: tetratricopeptide repeat protein [Rikenellaceae bacterium]